MSTKTFFKRAALVVVASLGLGYLSVPSSQASLVSQSITLGAATATATVGDSATGTWTVRFAGDAGAADSVVVKVACDAPTGATCPSILARQTPTADTANVFTSATAALTARSGSGVTANAPWVTIGANDYWGESAIGTGSVSARSAVSFKATAFPKAGTYTYTFSLSNQPTAASASSFTPISGTAVTWTVTVSAANTKATSVVSSYIAATNAQAAYYRYGNNGLVGPASSTDSSVVASAGSATSPAVAAVLYMVLGNSAGDTRVALNDGYAIVQDSLTVTITGAGTIAASSAATTRNSSIASLNVNNYGYGEGISTESVIVYSNGTAGVGTITVTNAAGTTLLTKTVTFTGPAASAAASLGDTYTIVGGSPALSAQVKDAGGNLLTSGTFYAFVSDTKIVSAGATLYSNAATQYQTSGRCSTWDVTTKRVSCSLTVADTGTVSVYFADSWNVTASSFVTTAISMTVTGNTIASATVAFDKATYAPGERAVITITTKDIAGNLHANGATGTFTSVTSNYALTGVTTLPQRGTASSDATFSTALTEFQDTGVETRVVNMPSVASGDVTYTVEIPGFGVGVANTKVTATAKVVDPVQTAQNTAIANAQAAADAATDAALQAIDAANAATDAANLAAEAADAATVAAQESKDSADAATAAVESLATQVATLMAALQAQITSLANVVAKIAKKVKA